MLGWFRIRADIIRRHWRLFYGKGAIVTTQTMTYDVVVAGAGPSGTAAALHLAKKGFSVALVDQRPFSAAGPGWANNVQAWLFEEADIPLPVPPELRCKHSGSLFVTNDDRSCFRLESTPFMATDMRLMMHRLHLLAFDAGVAGFDTMEITDLLFENDRPAMLCLKGATKDKASLLLNISARLFVDATGLSAQLRSRHPELSTQCKRPDPGRICHAIQQVRRIADPAGAQTYLERYAARDKEVVSFFGMEGGFSTINVQINTEENEVDILVGSMEPFARGAAMMDRLVADEPWIGEKISGGGAPIPVRRPYDRLSAPGLALVGDAACQVMPAHGSGIGMGFVAGAVLAEAVAGSDDPGDETALWSYQSQYMRKYGYILASYDVVSRMTQPLASTEIDTLLHSGLMSDWSMWWGMQEQMPRATPLQMLGTLRSVAKAPLLAAKVVPKLLPMPLVTALYKRYPQQPDMDALRCWSKKVGRLFGDPPEIS